MRVCFDAWCRVLWVWAAPCWTMGLTIWLDLNRQDSCGQIPSIVLVVIVLYFTVVVARMVCSWPYIPPQQKIIISEYTYARKNKRGSLRCVKKRPKPYGTLSVISAHMWRLPCNNSTQNKHITFWVDTRGAFAYQKLDGSTIKRRHWWCAASITSFMGHTRERRAGSKVWWC